MEEKNLNPNEELKNSENPVEQNKEMSVADRILQRIQEKKGLQSEETPVEETKVETRPVEPEKIVKAEVPEVKSEEIESKEEEILEKADDSIHNPAEALEKEETAKEVEVSEVKAEETKTEKIEKAPEPKKRQEKVKVVIPDFSEKSDDELLTCMQEYSKTENPLAYSKAVSTLKGVFYARINAAKDAQKEAYLKIEENDPKEFKYEADPRELEFSEAHKLYMSRKEQAQTDLDKEMKANLAAKHEIISAIEGLVNKPEAFGDTYNEFKDLQRRWNEIGVVPKDELKNIWDEYNRVVEAFFSYVKINQELRDLDLKKNMTLKLELCEKAEELLLEPKLTKAHSKLQNLHDRWREVGPVIAEKKEELWERFKAATIQINTKFQEHVEALREQQDKNLESKTFLCEKAEEVANGTYETRKEWKNASDQVIKIQTLWKGIGFVPKKNNNEIYDRFRAACDKFFERIREFYAEADAEREHNLQLKTDLCLQAESMQTSTDWRKTSDFYVKLQKEWKEIGPVPVKVSDKIWKRFRKACNTFFDSKKDFFDSRKTEEADNLKAKQALIEKIDAVDTKSNRSEAISKLKEYQKEWTEIGYVPFDKKDSIYKAYRDILDKKFGEMNLDAGKTAELEFGEKLSAFKDASNSEDLVNTEIGKLRNRIEKIENDIKIWENNLGFFANTKNAESMLKDFNKKIEKSKQQVQEYRKQINQLFEIQ